jgi:transposase
VLRLSLSVTIAKWTLQLHYRVEREARERELDASRRKALRDEKAKPIWDEMRVWLNQAQNQVPPRSLTGKALGYLDKQWPRLIACLADGRIEVDNNLCENAIRPFVMPVPFCTSFSSV